MSSPSSSATLRPSPAISLSNSSSFRSVGRLIHWVAISFWMLSFHLVLDHLGFLLVVLDLHSAVFLLQIPSIILIKWPACFHFRLATRSATSIFFVVGRSIHLSLGLAVVFLTFFFPFFFEQSINTSWSAHSDSMSLTLRSVAHIGQRPVF